MTGLSEEQIRPQQMMADKQQYVDADREFLLARREQWVHVPCPACNADDPRPYGQKQGFAYMECCACGTVYTSPRPSLALMHAFYAGSQNYAYWNEHIFPATEETRRERIFRPRAQRLAAYCQQFGMAGGAAMDVGAAFGTFCEELRAQGIFERIIALEPTPGLAATCRRRGFETLETFIEDVQETAFVDVLTAFEVLEHLFSPHEFVQQARRLLRPGGLLVLSFPSVRGFDALVLGVQAGMFDHEHVNYLHPGSVPLLLERGGFEVLDIQTPGQLDAELVRKQALAGTLDLTGQPFLRELLLQCWDELGGPFQQFLAQNRLSSHLWVVARSTA